MIFVWNLQVHSSESCYFAWGVSWSRTPCYYIRVFGKWVTVWPPVQCVIKGIRYTDYYILQCVYTLLYIVIRMIHVSLFKDHRKIGDIQMRCNILLQAALGLSYLHSEEGGLSAAVHLDVKRSERSMHLSIRYYWCYLLHCSNNILLDGAMRAKIGDFGFAMQLPQKAGGKSFICTSMLCGTPSYVAPEFLSG